MDVKTDLYTHSVFLNMCDHSSFSVLISNVRSYLSSENVSSLLPLSVQDFSVMMILVQVFIFF